jgi:hypothetical protein
MFSSREEEDLIVRWAVAEIIRYLRQKHSYKGRYLTSTRIHKILFKTFEELDIPITRSWFRYGCFIHSNELQPDNLNPIIKSYANTGNLGIRLGSRVGRLGIGLEDTESILWKNVDAIAFPALEDVLDELYKMAPEEFRDIFQVKWKLYNSLRDLKKISPHNIEEYSNWLLKVRKDLSHYHSSSFSLRNSIFSEVSHETFRLSELMEEALIKGLILAESHKLTKNKINRLRTFDEFFDENIWCPLAYGISEITVTGFRAEEIRGQQEYKRINYLKGFTSLISESKSSLLENDLKMSWSDSIEWYRLHRNADVEKSLLTVQKIYEHSTERA